MGPASVTDSAEQQTARQVFREMKTTTLGYAKNFALIGALFSGIECTIESVYFINYIVFIFRLIYSLFFRLEVTDWKNGTYAGVATGGLRVPTNTCKP